MFDHKKPAYMSNEDIDAIVAIKEKIAQELQWFVWDLDKEYDKLFEKHIKANAKLDKIKNIKL